MLIIEFSWGGGAMTVYADAVLQEFTLDRFRPWAKMLVLYSKPSQIEDFLHLLEDRIKEGKEQITDLEEALKTAKERQYRDAVKSELAGIKRLVKRWERMHEMLKGMWL